MGTYENRNTPIRRARRALVSAWFSQRPFYRRWPFESGVSLVSADARGAVELERGFFYNRIPKAANSTIALALATACSYDVEHWSLAKQQFLRPSSLSAAQLSSFADLRKFTFVRDPYTRVLSAYRDKVFSEGEVDGFPIADFTAFCRYLDSGGLMTNVHWAPQVDLLLLPLSEFDFVGRFERLEEDLQRVFALIGLPVLSPIKRAGPQDKGASRGGHYTQEAAAIVCRLYRRDFETFGYSPVLQQP